MQSVDHSIFAHDRCSERGTGVMLMQALICTLCPSALSDMAEGRDVPISKGSVCFLRLFPPWLIVPARAVFHGVVCVLRICFHGDFCSACGAAQVEPVDNASFVNSFAVGKQRSLCKRCS